jgi:hypothetical protein
LIRRFNYTGRRRIPRSRIVIRVSENCPRQQFDARLDLDGLRLPKEAAVFVEAYHRATYKRYSFGTIGSPHVPVSRGLDGIPVRRPLFRVKVVLVRDGIAYIMAAADKVVPESIEHKEDSRQSLLPVEYEDLGDRVWALDLESDWPRLILNRRFEGIREAARSAPGFLTLVYPEIFRAILSRILDEGRFDPDCDDDDWGTLWLRFACRELGQPRPPHHEGEATEWIDGAVNSFCARTHVATTFESMLAS